MTADDTRRLCADRPDGIPHLVDRPKAQRCDQHRAQRHRWSDANLYRKHNGLPPLPWEPEPLTRLRRLDALRQFADYNAVEVAKAARAIGDRARALRGESASLDEPERSQFGRALAQIELMTEDLLGIAAAMGLHPEL